MAFSPLGKILDKFPKGGPPAPPNIGLDAQRANLDAMRAKLANSAGPTMLKNESFQARNFDQFSPQFKAMRDRVESRSRANAQEALQAQNRKFASAGILNSGAAIKAQQVLQDKANMAREDALQGVTAQENEAKRAFQAQEDARQEASLGRNLQRDVSNADRAFQDRVFRFDANSKLGQLDAQLSSLALEQDAQEFNKRKSRYEAGRTGGLFGAGGFLGTGIGASDAEF